MERDLICGDCEMVFRSTGLLEKHKALLCMGRNAGHLKLQSRSSELLTRDKPGCVQPKQPRTADRGNDAIENTACVSLYVQLMAHCKNGTRWRSADAKPKSARAEGSGQQESAALQPLTDVFQFHNLKASKEENLPNWSKGRRDVGASGRQLGHSERLRERREMAVLHEQQLALIHAQHQQLEQQRDELTYQAGVLSEQSYTTHLESLLTELREQEQRNEETLQQLTDHLQVLHVREVSLPADRPDSCRNEKMHCDSAELIPCADGPLSAQIKALRQVYVQSGGSHPAIVARMIDLQAEALVLEKRQPAAASKKVKPPQRGLTEELLAVEQENQRLEEEILRIQRARRPQQNPGAAASTELRENLLQISSLLAEMERNRAQAPGPRRPPPPPTPPHLLPLQPNTHIHAPLSLFHARSYSSSPLGRCMLDLQESLGPTPYDPGAGFVVFYDLVLGVDVLQGALRLVTALYSEGQQVGQWTPLPPVQCLPDTHSLSPRNYALLSVKQPVSRVQPSLSLSLVVEFEAAGELDVQGPEVLKLAPCGWSRLELFDEFNQLRSGHMRVPVRSPPVTPSLSLVQLNLIPQVGNMELCLRLVNGRDGDMQTLVKPDPTCTTHYRYPAMVSSHLNHRKEALAIHPQPSDVNQLTPLPLSSQQGPTAVEARDENSATTT